MQTNQSHETLCFTTFIPPFPAKFSSHYTTSSQPQATHSSFTLIITDSARQRTTSSFHPPFQKLGIMIIRLSSQPPPLSSLMLPLSSNTRNTHHATPCMPIALPLLSSPIPRPSVRNKTKTKPLGVNRCRASRVGDGDGGGVGDAHPQPATSTRFPRS